MRALMRLQTIELLAAKAHRTLVVAQRAADAVHQRALARPIRSDKAQAFAGRNRERDIFQRNEAAEAFAQLVDLQERRCGAAACSRAVRVHGTLPGISASTRRRPTKSSGLR